MAQITIKGGKTTMEQKGSDTEGLKSLGSKNTTYLYDEPSKDILETFKNVHPRRLYVVPFTCDEFTSLCPKTGQPDFAKLHIIYVPDELMVESKSLKLYLFSFRQHGEFHEDVCNRIVNDLKEKLQPKYILLVGDFNVRGGIAIKPVVEYCHHSLLREDVADIRWRVEQYWNVARK